MQDKHGGQEGSRSNDRLEPTFGDLPELNTKAFGDGNKDVSGSGLNQNGDHLGTGFNALEDPLNFASFSAVDDDRATPFHTSNSAKESLDDKAHSSDNNTQTSSEVSKDLSSSGSNKSTVKSSNETSIAENSASNHNNSDSVDSSLNSASHQDNKVLNDSVKKDSIIGQDSTENTGSVSSNSTNASTIENNDAKAIAETNEATTKSSSDNNESSLAEKSNEEPEIEGNFLYKWREERRRRKAAYIKEKEMRAAGLLPKLSIWARMWRVMRYSMSLMVKLAVVGVGVFVVLFIYFDSMVIDGYEVDDKWVLPAVVYSRPLELYPDQRLSFDQMVYELKLLKYREVQSPRRPGEYALNAKNGRIVLIKRPFTFPDADEPRMSVLIEFDGKRVKRILNADNNQELSYMRMDPVLLDRINRVNPEEDRIFISIADVPKPLIQTLIEIEDRNYYDHFGINPVAIVRAFVKNLIAGRVVEGGSTITQQLVKNYFLTNERSYTRKIKELFMAMAMNRRYTKDQILEAYMNEIYLGQNGRAGIYGFGLASYFYFGVPVSELTLDQMALLVGLIKGPSYYDPWRYPNHALERRNTVLAVLRNRGHITEEQFEAYSQKPLNIIPRGQLSYSKTPAFMGLVKTEIATRFKDEEEKTGKDFLSGNGIRIFTSLDPQAQAAAEKAVTNEIAAIEKERKKKNLEAAMVVSSWRTGEVSAVVGSSNPTYDGFNRALDSRRQVGSLIKPFVYLTAFHQGTHLGSIVNDSPVKVKLPDGKIWSPNNDDKKFRGPIRVIRAMANSLNVPTVRVGMAAGLDNVVNTLHAVGYKRDVPLYPSIVLGTPEISPYELNSMYVGMATEGIYRDLTTLRTIEKNGEIVYQRGGNRSPRTLDPKDTYLAIYGMTEATRSGTGKRLAAMFPGVTIASKTGTTNDFRDSWTVGMDSDELSTVWVGYDNNKSTGLYGSTGAMRLYGAYLKERGVNSLDLKRPEGVIFVNFDKDGNVLANGCEEPGMERYPAREDRIQYVKLCNVFDAGSNDLPYVIAPGAMQQTPAANNNNAAPAPQGSVNNNSAGVMQLYGNSPAANNQGNNINQQNQTAPGQLHLQPDPAGALNNNAPAAAGSEAGFARGPAPVAAPNTDALNSSSVEDSGAKDVDPVKPDDNARPTQQSSQHIENQADSFEDQLLGIF